MGTDARLLHPSSERRLLAGVALRIARRLRVDALWIRIAFVLLTVGGGIGLPLYLVGWVLLADSDDGAVLRVRTGRGALEVGLGAGLLVASALLTLRALDLWISDALIWPFVLVAAGGALIWRTSQSSPPAAVDVPVPESPRARPQTPERAAAVLQQRAGWAAAAVSRTGVGIALVVAAALVFLQATGALGAARDVALAAFVVAVALGVIFAPWILRLVRSLDAERAERIRSQERAEVAAHLHDSVLQTLALVQKRAESPGQVAALARSQERELRAWLSGRRDAPGGPRRLRASLEAAAGEVEQAHGAEVDLVAVGDAELGEGGEALVAAAREAMLNAARHGGTAVSVYAEASDGRATVFVRDRGQGFDPAEVPADRRGISESIVGRMSRHGGRAEVRSTPGQGTEVELELRL